MTSGKWQTLTFKGMINHAAGHSAWSLRDYGDAGGPGPCQRWFSGAVMHNLGDPILTAVNKETKGYWKAWIYLKKNLTLNRA